jgi:polyphosphate kinase
MIKDNRNLYLEREISWMYFNHRVLQEAQDKTVPLLERLKFLGIYSNNLDEFFRVRVALLERIITLKELSLKYEKRIAQDTLTEVNKLYKKYSLEFDETFKSLKQELKKQNICLLDETQISAAQREQIRQLYNNTLNSHLYPRFFSRKANFKDINDESVYLAVKLTISSGKNEYALLELPSSIFGRFIKIDSDREGKKAFMFLDDVVRVCLPDIFVGKKYTNIEAHAFKLTKDAEIDIDIRLQGDIMKKVSQAVQDRKWGNPVRFIFDNSISPDMLAQIQKAFAIRNQDNVVAGSRYHNLKDLISFPDCQGDNFHYAEWKPLFVRKIIEALSVMDTIKRQDILLHYPYYSFSNYVRLLREAAISKEVHTIKITLYRLAKNSSVVEALICAAKNGKKVTAVVELLARFDEASNIYWSKKMQEAGINVITGIDGLKIHSKLTFIKGTKGAFACINTGNFHEGNAKMYTDLTLMTANKSIVKEVEDVFKFIQKPYIVPEFKKLIISPLNSRKNIKTLIANETRNAKLSKEAYIKCKINHITDQEIIDKLYEASTAGVKIELLVRGSCSIITGIVGVSENITVKSIVDRYLEHSRIFIFCNGGKEKYFIGSADWIYRNFDARVEVLAPVFDEKIQLELKRIVEYGLKDNIKGRIVDGSGDNRIEHGEPAFRSQEELYEYYNANLKTNG